MSAVLHVGPGQPYALLSQAIAAAHDGDTIQIDTRGNYFNDTAVIRRNHLTIEGVGPGRAVLRTDGRVWGNMGILVFAQGFEGLTLENLDLEGARVAGTLGANGAGLRSLGTDLAVVNCRFYNNQDGILGGYGITDIERSEFADNGLTGFTHNVYIAAGTLIFRYNYSHDTLVGHLLKSRAAVNLIEYNRLTDEQGTGSYEVDLPNGGRCDLVGNVIEQGPNSQNGGIIAYGEEGLGAGPNELNVVNNTIVNDRFGGTFIDARNLPAGFRLVARNDVFAGPGTTIQMDNGAPVTGGNLVTSVAAAGFVDAAQYDYHLISRSPAINIGVAPGIDGSGLSLTPVQQYVHPTAAEPRPADARLDAGAFEYVPPPLPGDANGDGVVNFADLLILAQNYGKSGTTFSQGDFNGDGLVSFADLLLLVQYYRP